eukprot:Sdes_comp19429_c0_seq1m10801
MRAPQRLFFFRVGNPTLTPRGLPLRALSTKPSTLDRRPIGGVRDWDAEATEKYEAVLSALQNAASLHNFRKVMPSILENSANFIDHLGQTTDIVEKEMFLLPDDHNSQRAPLCLRPEGTLGCVRMFGNSRNHFPVKAFYCGPMFRRETPQRGRFREFFQFGVEHFWKYGMLEETLKKSTNYFPVENEVNILLIAERVLSDLRIRHLTDLHVNTLGDDFSRSKYTAELAEYFCKNKHHLSNLSRERLSKGAVLRILDSKEPQDQAVIADAPPIICPQTLTSNYLSAKSMRIFLSFLDYLNHLNIPYIVDKSLVRGLDYYNDIVFEYLLNTDDSKSALIAGGRYDSFLLLPSDQGSSLPSHPNSTFPYAAMGWAAGVDRLLSLLESDTGSHISDARIAPSPQLVPSQSCAMDWLLCNPFCAFPHARFKTTVFIVEMGKLSTPGSFSSTDSSSDPSSSSMIAGKEAPRRLFCMELCWKLRTFVSENLHRSAMTHPHNHNQILRPFIFDYNPHSAV